MADQKYYVYCFIDGHEIVYVGKGSGRRVKQQSKRFQCEYKILERTDSETLAYEREKHWIAELKPTMNLNSGGAGGLSEELVPRKYRTEFSLKEWKRLQASAERERNRIEAVGTRKFAATVLLSKLDERNCEQFGISKIDVSRWREVANGPRC